MSDSNRDIFPAIAKELGLDLASTLTDAPYKTPEAMWALCGGDANVESAIVVFSCNPEEVFSVRDRETLDCLAAHVGSALAWQAMVIFLRS